MCLERQTGFSIIAAIFLVVVLALLAAFIASVTGIQQSSGQLDVLGVRAYQGARAGLEWSAWQIIDPGNTLNPGPTCAGAVMPTCFASPQNLPPLAGSLSGFTVTVTCAQTADTTEGNRKVRVFQIVATACNQPSAGPSCPNVPPPVPTNGYVERQVQASLAKCKDLTAQWPGCACG